MLVGEFTDYKLPLGLRPGICDALVTSKVYSHLTFTVPETFIWDPVQDKVVTGEVFCFLAQAVNQCETSVSYTTQRRQSKGNALHRCVVR